MAHDERWIIDEMPHTTANPPVEAVVGGETRESENPPTLWDLGAQFFTPLSRKRESPASAFLHELNGQPSITHTVSHPLSLSQSSSLPADEAPAFLPPTDQPPRRQ